MEPHRWFDHQVGCRCSLCSNKDIMSKRDRKINPVFARHYKPDERDKQFRMSSLLTRSYPKKQQYWPDTGWFGDQKDTPFCVGYAWAHWIEDGPVRPPMTKPMHDGVVTSRTPPYVQPATIYHEAQLVDEWSGEDYEGTSVRAAAKVLKKFGLIESYWWADTLEDIVCAVLERGPVVIGSDWRQGMMKPKGNAGHINAQGESLGGHAYLINGVSIKAQEFRIKNSWGREWGSGGRARIRFHDIEMLMMAGDFEACIAIEKEPPPPPASREAMQDTGCNQYEVIKPLLDIEIEMGAHEGLGNEHPYRSLVPRKPYSPSYAPTLRPAAPPAILAHHRR